MKEFKLPDPGEGLTEAEIVSWKVKPGDTIKVNDVLVEIETAKSLVELPSPYAGTVAEILVPEGTEVAVGTPIVVIDDGSGLGSAAPRSASVSSHAGSNAPRASEAGSNAPRASEASRGDEAPKPTAHPDAEQVPTQPAAGGGRQFLLPDPGEGLTEAEIVSWKVKPGDTIKVNDVLVEIETAKSLVELPSPYAGTVAEILVPEGTEVAVGTPIVVIDDGSSNAPRASEASRGDDESAGPNLVGYGSKPGASRRRARKAPQADHPSKHAMAAAFAGQPAPELEETTGPALPHVADSEALTAQAPQHGGAKVLAKPPVRKFAKDRGIDLAQVTGTGPDGVITRADVEQFLASGPAAASEPAADAPAPAPRAALSDRREPIKGVRKVTAKAMTSSAFQKVHVTEWVDVDVTATMALIETIKARREWRNAKVSPLLIWMKAVCLALAQHPGINASWDEQAGEIVYHGDVNLGFAAATPRGLMVPNVKGAQDLSLRELNDRVQELIGIARDGKLQPADYAHGTFTITNVGVFGVDAGTPIINGDESAILAMGSITRKPWVVGTPGVDERIEPRWVTTMALSFDHRLIDGEEGSTFLRDVADMLANPGLGLLF